MVVLRVTSIANFTVYDTKCMIFEHASMVDCHQEGLWPDPESWIFAWIFLSFLSSLSFLIISWHGYKLGLLKFHRNKVSCAWKKSSFVSLFLLIIPTSIYYAFRIASGVSGGKNRGTSSILLIWPTIMWIVVWALNYTSKVRIGTDLTNCPNNWSPNCCSRVHRAIWFFYWTSIIMYLCETFFKLLSVMLDVAYDLAPVIERRFPDESLKGIIAILSGLRLAFHSKLFVFFWDKFFHGDKDLFSESYHNLEDEHETVSNDNELETLTNEEENDATTSNGGNRQDETIF